MQPFSLETEKTWNIWKCKGPIITKKNKIEEIILPDYKIYKTTQIKILLKTDTETNDMKQEAQK